jgi:hypothetical protein
MINRAAMINHMAKFRQLNPQDGSVSETPPAGYPLYKKGKGIGLDKEGPRLEFS